MNSYHCRLKARGNLSGLQAVEDIKSALSAKPQPAVAAPAKAAAAGAGLALPSFGLGGEDASKQAGVVAAAEVVGALIASSVVGSLGAKKSARA